MTALLTDNLPLLAGAPNGIRKLRELILELAVRGKLVPQDPSDEPASELLKRIAEEKARLVAEGKIKKQKPLAEIGEEERPFELPEGWEWVCLGEVSAYIQRGKGPAYVEKSDFRVVSQKCVRWSGLDLNPARYIDPESIKKYEEVRFLCQGDILWNSTGTGTIGRACVVDDLPEGKPLVADSHVTVVRPIGVLPGFLWRLIQSPGVQSEIEGGASGTTNQIELNTSTVVAHLIPVPPLAEQHRIIAKVDELMALCDRLEARQADAEIVHARLVQALLDSLTQASDADDFAASWQRLAEHFHSLFTSESSIDALKQTLLQLAVMGKLVPQVHTERVDELIAEISIEKQRLIDVGVLKKAKHSSEVSDDERPFSIPETWAWVRLGDIAAVVDPNPSHRMPKYVEKGIPFISTENFSHNDGIDFDLGKKVSVATLDEQVSKFEIREGAFAISRIGTIGKTRPLPVKRDYCLSHALCVISPYLNVFNSIYLRVAVTADNVLIHAHSGVKSIGVPDLGVGTIRSMPIPVPPPAEQDLIVAKVDELMALCDQLKARLSATRQLHERLAGVLVEQAVA